MDDFLKSIRDRVSAPFWGNLIIAELLINWKFLAILFASEIPIEDRIVTLDDHLPNGWVWFAPFLLAGGFTILIPRISLWFGELNYKALHHKRLLQLRSDAEVDIQKEKNLAVLEEARSIRKESAVRSAQADQAAREIDNDELSQRLEDIDNDELEYPTSKSDTEPEAVNYTAEDILAAMVRSPDTPLKEIFQPNQYTLKLGNKVWSNTGANSALQHLKQHGFLESQDITKYPNRLIEEHEKLKRNIFDDDLPAEKKYTTIYYLLTREGLTYFARKARSQ